MYHFTTKRFSRLLRWWRYFSLGRSRARVCRAFLPSSMLHLPRFNSDKTIFIWGGRQSQRFFVPLSYSALFSLSRSFLFIIWLLHCYPFAIIRNIYTIKTLPPLHGIHFIHNDHSNLITETYYHWLIQPLPMAFTHREHRKIGWQE